MAKRQADVEFVIKSKNLSSKSIKEVTSELHELIDAQERQRQVAAASSSVIESLQGDYKKLAASLEAVKSARGRANDFARDEAQFRRVSDAIRDNIAQLDKLRQGQARLRESGQAVPADLLKKIEKLEGQNAKLMSQAGQLASSLKAQRSALAELGVEAKDSATALRQLAEVEGKIVVAQVRTTQATSQATAALARQEQQTRESAEAERRYQQELAETIRFEQERAAAARKFRQLELNQTFADDTARRLKHEQEITAEVQRRNAIEGQAEARRLAAMRREGDEANRIAAKRADSIAAFSQATPSQLRNPQKRSDVIGLSKDMDRLAASTKRASAAQKLWNDDTRKSLGVTQRLRGQVLSLVSAYVGVFEAINIGRKAIQTDIDRQGALIRLQVANKGDISKAGDEFNYVREQADRLGQSLTPLANQYSKFAIASRGAGVSAETTRQVFEDFAEVATTLQLSQENVDGIFRALEQSFSKGIVQAEELRGQLGDRLPGAFTKLATAMGVTTAELNDLLQKGEVSAKVLPLLGEFMADEVAGQLPAATKTARAELERLKTAFDDFLVGIANSGFREAIRSIAVDLSAFFSSVDGKAFAQDIALSFSMVVQAGKTLLPVLDELLFALKAFLAVGIARWFAGLATSVGTAGAAGAFSRFVVVLARVVTGANSAAAAVRFLGRAIKTSLGPIVLILTLAAEAFIYLKAKTDAASEAAEHQAEVLRDLRQATGAELDAAIELADQEVKAKKSALEVAEAKAVQARATYDAAAALLSEHRALDMLLNLTSLGRMTKATVLGVLQGQAEDAEKAAKSLRDQLVELGADRGFAVARRAEESEKIEIGALGHIARLEKVLSDKTTLAKLQNDQKYFNKVVVWARETAKLVAKADQDAIDETTRRRLEAVQGAIGQLQVKGLGINLGGGDKKESDKAAKAAEKARKAREKDAAEAQRLADKRVDIARDVEDKLAQIDSDIASASTEANAASVEQIEANYKAALAKIAANITKQRNDLAALRDKAVKANAPTAGIDRASSRLDVLEEAQRTQAKHNSLVEEQQLHEKELNDLIEIRTQKLENIATLEATHQLTAFEAKQAADKVELDMQDQILAKVKALRDFIVEHASELAPGMNVEAYLLKLDEYVLKAKQAQTATQQFLGEWGGKIADGIANTFATLAEGIANVIQGAGSLSDAFKGARDAFLSFAADFLIEIGKMIIQAIILRAIQNAMSNGASSGGYGQAAMGAIGIGAKHTGGMIGAPSGAYRNVSPLVFANAPRYHNGGFPGLRSDEVPIIAQRGEEMLSRTDPRNALNGGLGAQSPQVKIINAIDSASVVNEAMNRRDGQTPVINMMKARRQEIKAALGIK